MKLSNGRLVYKYRYYIYTDIYMNEHTTLLEIYIMIQLHENLINYIHIFIKIGNHDFNEQPEK